MPQLLLPEGSVNNQLVGMVPCQQPQSQVLIDSAAVSAGHHWGGFLYDHKPHCPQLCPLAALPLSIFQPYCLSLRIERPSISGVTHGWSHLYTMHLWVYGLFPPNKGSLLLMALKQIILAFHWYFHWPQ